jgi:hypothetical protein
MVVSVFLAIGYTAHQTGTQLARADVERLNTQLVSSVATGQELGQRNAQLQSELNATRLAQGALQRRYDNEVPRGAIADLMSQIRARLDGELTTERLAQVIHQAEPVMLCDGPVVSRRFRIGMEQRGAGDDTTSFAEGMVRVRAVALGTATDLGQTTVVTFIGLGVEGGSLSITGLPAQMILALGNRALPLSVSASGVPGFVTASLTTCRPG